MDSLIEVVVTEEVLEKHPMLIGVKLVLIYTNPQRDI
jgi:hypothetical protein